MKNETAYNHAMFSRFGKLSLRDLFWLMLLAAVGVGWYLERQRAAKQIADHKQGYQLWGVPTNPTPGALARQKLLREYGALSNQELNQQFSKLGPATPFHSSAEYSCCLTEMARRRMHAELQVHFDELQKNGSKEFGGPADALLLTALRRAEGKPDPIEVQVKVLDSAPKMVEDRLEHVPEIHANLKNIDPLPISLTNGGDYRSGRQTRWRVELTDTRGRRSRPLPDANFPLFGMGGGISGFGPVEPGKVINEHGYTLDARSYVHLPASGKYQLQLIYAEEEIASEPDLEGLIVWRSKPLPVIVENLTPEFENRFSAVPLLAVLVIGLIVVLQSRTSKSGAGLNVRDWIALTLLIGIALGWLIDSQLQQREIRNVRPDAKTQWTIKAAD